MDTQRDGIADLRGRQGPMRTPYWIQRSGVIERFMAKVDLGDGDGCWTWTAGKNGRGYGRFNVGRGIGPKLAHRVAYELMVGPIPEGLTIDHLCFNKACVRPDHLEAVPERENWRRGLSRIVRVAECRHGHPYDKDNTYWVNGRRYCRECGRRNKRAYKARQKGAAA